jgi:hypothetical protein
MNVIAQTSLEQFCLCFNRFIYPSYDTGLSIMFIQLQQRLLAKSEFDGWKLKIPVLACRFLDATFNRPAHIFRMTSAPIDTCYSLSALSNLVNQFLSHRYISDNPRSTVLFSDVSNKFILMLEILVKNTYLKVSLVIYQKSSWITAVRN